MIGKTGPKISSMMLSVFAGQSVVGINLLFWKPDFVIVKFGDKSTI